MKCRRLVSRSRPPDHLNPARRIVPRAPPPRPPAGLRWPALRRGQVIDRPGERWVEYHGRSEGRATLRAAVCHAAVKRPISDPQMDVLVDDVVHEIESEYEREVPSTVIGRKVMDKLEKTDEVAFLRFASVYRRFRDASQFLSEIENLIGRQ